MDIRSAIMRKPNEIVLQCNRLFIGISFSIPTILGVPVAILLKSAMKLHKRRNGFEIGLQNFFALEEIHLEGYC